MTFGIINTVGTMIKSIKEFILSFPTVYNLVQNGLISKEADLYGRFINVPENAKVLDIGCGPAQVLERIPPSVEYHGFDLSDIYIRAAAEKYKHRNAFFKCSQVRSETLKPEMAGTFDMVLALGVIHHIDDADALSLMRLAKAALKENGVLVTNDVCFQPRQKIIAKMLAKMDRGEYVRYVDHYNSLAEQVFCGQVRTFILDDALRLPYNTIIMRMVK